MTTCYLWAYAVVDGLQVCWGPLSFVVAWFIMTSNPLRHPTQLIVSLGQLYGDVLYFATCFFDSYYRGLTYSRPEAHYFWGYFCFINLIWIIIPSRKCFFD